MGYNGTSKVWVLFHEKFSRASDIALIMEWFIPSLGTAPFPTAQKSGRLPPRPPRPPRPIAMGHPVPRSLRNVVLRSQTLAQGSLNVMGGCSD